VKLGSRERFDCRDRQFLSPALKLRHSPFLKEFQMMYLMPCLLELSGSERIYIQNLIAQIPLQQAEVFLIEYREILYMTIANELSADVATAILLTNRRGIEPVNRFKPD
jgi:hypothetical protein